MTHKTSTLRKTITTLALSAILAGSMAIVSSKPVRAQSCPVGYAKNNAGLCVNVTTQRPVVSKASKRATAYALCLTNTPNWTPTKQKSCMRAKGYK